MHKLKYLSISVILAILLSLAGLSFAVSAHPLAATALSPTLGKAASYSVLAYSTVTNDGYTTMPGDLGVSPKSAVTGFPPGSVGPPGHIHRADGSAHDAQVATSAAFDFLDQGCTGDWRGTGPVNLTPDPSDSLGPGVYCADAFLLTTHLILTGGGPDDVWIFKSASTLITSTDSLVTGGDPCNIWWRLGKSATIEVGTAFEGNILAYANITLNDGASLTGRALAETEAVNLHNNAISDANCLAAPAHTATSKPKAKATSKPTNLPSSSEQTATALAGLPGLPSTGGGAPIQDEDFPWSPVFVGGLCAMALVLGFRAFRRAYRPKT